MKVTRRIVVLAALVTAVGLFVGCSPNSLLTAVQDRVQEAQGGQVVATPQFTPAPVANGTYTSSLDFTVTINCDTSGATVHYTIDGSTPSVSTSVYTGPIPLAGNGTTFTIKAIGMKSGMTDSLLVQGTFTVNYTQVSTPEFTPPAGTYAVDQSVTISTTTPGASIRYTTDGSTPTSASGTLYSTPVNVAASETIKAIAYESGWSDSTASASYVLQAAAPTFGSGGGYYSSAQSVTISTTTPGASLRYSTDGSTPTSVSGTLYSTPVGVVASETIKAIAYKSGWADSPVSSATYAISGTALWARTVSNGASISNFNSTAVDASGNVYAAGYINGTGAYTFAGGITATGTAAGANVLLVKYLK